MWLNLHLSLYAILLLEAWKLIVCCNNFYLYKLHLPSWHTSAVSAVASRLVEYATRLTFNHWGGSGWYTLYLPVQRDGGLPDIIFRALSSLLLVVRASCYPCLREGELIWSSLASVSLTPSTMFLDCWCFSCGLAMVSCWIVAGLIQVVWHQSLRLLVCAPLCHLLPALPSLTGLSDVGTCGKTICLGNAQFQRGIDNLVGCRMVTCGVALTLPIWYLEIALGLMV